MIDDDAPIERLRNLGRISAAWLRDAGVETVGDLRRLGPVEAYRRVRMCEPRRANRNLLWALQAGLMDMDFRDLPGEIKRALAREFETP